MFCGVESGECDGPVIECRTLDQYRSGGGGQTLTVEKAVKRVGKGGAPHQHEMYLSSRQVLIIILQADPGIQ